jgi:hypothetical protein
VSTNGDGTKGDTSPDDGAVPRLTIGQRVLASLPNLQRQTPTVAPAPERPARKAGATGTDDSAGAVVSPDEIVAPGTEAPGTEASAPSGKRRDAFFKPPAPRQPRGAPSGMTAAELTHIIKKIDDRERSIALGTAVIGVVVAIVLTIAVIRLNPPLHAKNHQDASEIVIYGVVRVVFAALAGLAARTRRRSFVGFALLFLGTSMLPDAVFALPFWAVGGWLIFRALKWQKELAAMTGQTRSRPAPPERTAPVARGRDAAEARRQARAQRMTARSAGGRRGKKQPEPKGPPPNKRYTPPKPTRTRPPAS